MRHRVRPRHSSILPPSLHKRNKRSTCQRARCNTITSEMVSFSAGTLVIKMVHLARLKASGWAWALPRRRAFLADARLALLDDFFWHPHQDQACGQFGALADQHLP